MRTAPARRRIVFYSEGPAYWVHLGPVVESLLEMGGGPICYVSSDERDPGLALEHPDLSVFCVGEGVNRTLFFQFLEAGLLVMTMPDLETFHIKRSSAHPVHYVYLFHSLVSTHMIYRKGAFDHFDALLTAGPHHDAEIRENERIHELPEKRLLPHGYHRLEAIMERAGRHPGPSPEGPLKVLIAPSWGESGLLELGAEPLVAALLEAGFQVTVRPHPQTRRLRPEALDGLMRRFGGDEDCVFEEEMADQESLQRAHVMISDWSGAALEYAFGLERPVLFIDTPRKVNNPDYGKLSQEPLEVRLRNEIGAVLAPEEMVRAPEVIRDLTAAPDAFAARIRACRARWVHHPGESARRGAEHLLRLSREAATQPQ